MKGMVLSCLFFFFFWANGWQPCLTVNGFAFVQEELRWVRTGGLASGTLSFRPVQIYGRGGLAAPTGHGDSVIRLVLRVLKTQNPEAVKLPDQNVFDFLEDIIIQMEIVFARKYLCSLINESDRPSFVISHTFWYLLIY